MSRWVSELLSPLGDLPPLATVAVACIIVTTVTELASNATTITIFLPILSPLVGNTHKHAQGDTVSHARAIPDISDMCDSYMLILLSHQTSAVVFLDKIPTRMKMVKLCIHSDFTKCLPTI